MRHLKPENGVTRRTIEVAVDDENARLALSREQYRELSDEESAVTQVLVFTGDRDSERMGQRASVDFTGELRVLVAVEEHAGRAIAGRSGD
jgi:hypothetical protein